MNDALWRKAEGDVYCERNSPGSFFHVPSGAQLMRRSASASFGAAFLATFRFLGGVTGLAASLALGALLAPGAQPAAGQGTPAPLKLFISVDMEGISGIGTPAMTSSSGKDYGLGRELMTEDVLAVIRGIRAHGPAEILVNESHGDMQNLLLMELPEDVEVIQGSNKPLGMVQGLDASFDAAIFVGYHARAGTEDGFIAHTGSGSVKGLWIGDVEVGEGGLNAYYAGSLGVPVILATGDTTFTEQFGALVPARTVAVKTAIGSQVARLVHPEVAHRSIQEATMDALADLGSARPLTPPSPLRVQMRFASTTRADILQVIPGFERVGGTTVAFGAPDMTAAYKLVRLAYKFISW